MVKKVAIVQSNYIPWKGYFDIINSADVFVLYDSVQYTRNDWRNRNKIKTAHGLRWITIPVQNTTSKTIRDTMVVDNHWRKKHWNMLSHNYSKSKYFNEYKEIMKNMYLDDSASCLSEINYGFIKVINEILKIKTDIVWSNEFKIKGDKSEKLLQICKQLEATEYISGPAAKDYIDMQLFEKADIKVSWVDYLDYPEYSQLHAPFEHNVSILDLIFNEGPNAYKFMQSFKM